MNIGKMAIVLAVAMALGTAAWSLAGDDDKKEQAEAKTYTPTVEEWLQVYLNANFGRNDTLRQIGFVVMSRTKKISMIAYISEDHPRERMDPAHKQKLKIEADHFEMQAKGYAKRFGFEVERQELPGS